MKMFEFLGKKYKELKVEDRNKLYELATKPVEIEKKVFWFFKKKIYRYPTQFEINHRMDKYFLDKYPELKKFTASQFKEFISFISGQRIYEPEYGKKIEEVKLNDKRRKSKGISSNKRKVSKGTKNNIKGIRKVSERKK
jgi:hypothetical protein